MAALDIGPYPFMQCKRCNATWGHGASDGWPFYVPHPNNGCPNSGATAWDEVYFARGIRECYKRGDLNKPWPVQMIDYFAEQFDD